MKTIRETFRRCKNMADLCQLFRNSCHGILYQLQADLENLQNGAQNERTELELQYSNLTGAVHSAAASRNGAVEHALVTVNDRLNCIADPNWHRRRDSWFRGASSGTYLPAGWQNASADCRMELLRSTVEELNTAAAKLDHGFLPPIVAGVVGAALPDFRKALYTRIAVLREDVLRLCRNLRASDDLTHRQAALDGSRQAVDADIDCRLASQKTACTQRAGMQLREMRAAAVQQMNLPALQEDLAGGARDIFLGLFTCTDPCLSLLKPHLQELYTVDSNTIAYPVFADMLDQSILFDGDGETQISGYFTSLALDVLEQNPDARVCFMDIAGLGRSYAGLGGLSRMGALSVLSTPDQVTAGLQQISGQIAAVYAGASVPVPTYLFVERIPENIPERDAQLLLRILRNGPGCGVYTVASLNRTAEVSRSWQSVLLQLREAALTLETLGSSAAIGAARLALITRSDNTARADALVQALTDRRAVRRELPLTAALPTGAQFRGKSSAQGIDVPIGLSPRGKPVYLRFTLDRPYVLITGDVGSGKSSALHCIALQILANYAPSEVHLAVGDFKNGCEFNSYVTAGVPGVEAVVSSEDPDAMASFLRCYVAQMRQRQQLFDQASRASGRPVRKYESYRAVCQQLGADYVPRVVLIVDEFQSLFDGGISSTGALLSELVRKGRTYGIHIVMASQRAVSDNPRSGFSAELKNYFTTRLVFKCPQQVARTVLSERCADTGRENSGIAAASLLETGHAVMNTYMGQTEADNGLVQCFYASDDAISDLTRLLRDLGGGQVGTLVEEPSTSPARPAPVPGLALLGHSMTLHADAASGGNDVILDDGLVALVLSELRGNVLITGADHRLPLSVLRGVMDGVEETVRVRVSADPTGAMGRAIAALNNPRITLYPSPAELPPPEAGQITVNLICDPDRHPDLTGTSSYRTTPAVEVFKRVLDWGSDGSAINLIYSTACKPLRTAMPYLMQSAPIRIAAVGDSENVKAALGETTSVIRGCAFDVPSALAIKAYYCNRTTDKCGKVVLYAEP